MKLYSEKYKNALFVLFAALIAVLCMLVFFYSQKIDDYRASKLTDSLNDILRAEMKRQLDQATSLALVIASNEELERALATRDRKAANHVVDMLFQTFEQYKRGNFELQIHTQTQRVFLRSWDRRVYDIPLDSFRRGIAIVKETKKPFSSIELGRQLNIKAIVPVMFDGSYVGSLEIIKSFDDAVENEQKNHISLFVLMDQKYLGRAEWMTHFPRLGQFVMCQHIYDKHLFDELNGKNIDSLAANQNGFVGNYFLAFEPLRDIDGTQLGFFVSAITKKHALAAMRQNSDISILFNTTKEELDYVYKIRSSNDNDTHVSKEIKTGVVR